MGLKEDFDRAAEEAKTLPDNTTDQDKLDLYGLFKQASVGDVNTPKPGLLDFKGKAKWGAWEKQKGKSQEAAMQEYIELVASLKAKYA
ncbi:acyl-binding [Micractinium conductrix]|uniref:Acyl-binding n=1 Tax=Micractinium conductrix TaxID=554055 RepID=A0A2P6VNX0_9CHLO|nr:acyl-binding [Micractinium conductrix]|eukprot:PSC75802.1 acyl-binding [Micractinium conductrix]